MRSLRPLFAGVALVLGTLVMAGAANATLLSDLTNYAPGTPAELTPKLTIGDKEFYNFKVTITGIPTYLAAASNIDVTTVDQGGTYGLHFGPGSPTAPMILAFPGGFVDVLLDFDVKVTDPNRQISDVSMSFVANTAPGSGLAEIVETVKGGTNQPTLLSVSTLGTNQASAELNGLYSAVHVTKDILAIGPAPANPINGSGLRVANVPPSTAINEFTQLFIQTPEPASALLVMLGVVTMLRRRSLRKLSTLAVVLGLGLTGVLMQPSTASAVALSTLDGTTNTLSYGDFTFSNFHFNIVGNIGSNLVDTTAIDVQGFTTEDGSEDGLRFAGTMASLSYMTANSSLSMTLDYDVTPNNTTRKIHDVTMSFNGSVTPASAPVGTDPSALGRALVGKTILLDGAGIGDGVTVWNAPGTPAPLQLEDHQVLPNGPYLTTLQVHDRIILEGGLAGATTISFINQTFSVVPEPAVMLMALLGLPMLARRRTR